MIVKPSNENLDLVKEAHHVGKRKSIKKFIKQKKKKFKKREILEKSQEIKKHFKVKENLKLLNKYVKHIRAQSSGTYYNRHKGMYEQRSKFNQKLYKGFIKARTPKYSNFRGFDFTQLLQKGDPTSEGNLRNSRHKEFFKALTHLSNKSMNRSQKSDSNIANKSRSKSKEPTLKSSKKRLTQPLSSLVDRQIKNDISLFNIGSEGSGTMKKTLEENNKEREINLVTENESERHRNDTLKYASAPTSNKNSDTHESIFTHSMKLAAYRASELKKRNRDLIQKYGSKSCLSSSKLELDFIK